MIVNFGELAKAIGKSEPTLRKLLEDNPDWPVVERGTNGVGYKFDLEQSITFYQSMRERAEEAERARQVEINQIAMEFLGGDSVNGDRDPGLTAADRKALIEEELAALKLAIARGEYVSKASVEQALGDVLVWFREKGKSFSARLARRHDVPRSLMTAIDELVEADQHELADRMKRAGAAEEVLMDVAGEDSPDTAV